MQVMGEPRWACVLLHVTLMIGTAFAGKGIIRCDCTTHECIEAGKTICVAKKTCYTELYENKLTRGCDPNGLACENRRPSGLDVQWPTVHCCKDKDLCNKHVIPNVSGNANKIPNTNLLLQENLLLDPGSSDDNNNKNNNKDQNNHRSPNNNDNILVKPDCPLDTAVDPLSSSSDPSTERQPKTKIINPVYIAVPVAGVCVLLALIIFAMYLLRRRTVYHHGHHHDNFHHYHHEHVPDTILHKQTATRHCQCVCKKQTLPPCSKGNRCTESERSSSGSETKLFLQT